MFLTARPRRGGRCAATLCLVLALGLSACAVFKPSIGTRSVQLQAAEGLNDDSPLAVDIVFVYDEALLDRLGGTDARQWFRDRGQIGRDFPRGFEVVSFELVPEQTLAPFEVPERAGAARAGLVFADYRAAGAHRARFGHLNRVMIRLGKESFTVEAAQ